MMMDTAEGMMIILLLVVVVCIWLRVRRHGSRMEVVVTGMGQKDQDPCQDVRGSVTTIETVLLVRGEVVGADQEKLEDGVIHVGAVVGLSSSKLYSTTYS